MEETKASGIARAFRTYVGIVLFRKGPEDLPVSQRLLVITIGANMLLGLVFGSVMPLPETNRLGVAAVETVFLVAWYWALLRFAGRPERFLQTTSAIFGHQTILLPAFMFVTWLYLSQPKDAQMQVHVILPLIGLALWTLAIGTRIVRSATQWPTAACVALMLLQALVGQVLVLSLFPEAAANAASGAEVVAPVAPP